MNLDFAQAMRQAARLTRETNLIEATQVIQRALSGLRRAGPLPDPSPGSVQLIAPPKVSADPERPCVETSRHESNRAPIASRREDPPARARRPLGESLKLLREAAHSGLAHRLPTNLRKPPPVPVPEGAVYLTRTHTCPAGIRDYKVYVPSNADGRTLPLIVMLHGCAQNPDDFAVGTGMNALAEELGFIVAYPRQPPTANPSACWNWFNPADQRRDQGEPGIIAGVTRAIMDEHRIDAGRVYVAGLSAGGAMAAVMSGAYPDLYAAAGIHSGLAHGSATDVASAFAAMRGAPGPRLGVPAAGKSRVRTIVFHGASDKTVDPSNAEAILERARAGVLGLARERRDHGFAGGRAYRRTVIEDTSGTPHAECWEIDGLGHAWSGGAAEGSYTDPRGPNASREMLRFFLAAPVRPKRSE